MGGLLCFGYYDRDQGVPLEDSVAGPVPMLYPACALHRPALVEWAEYLWGSVGPAAWVPPEAFDLVKRDFAMDDEPVVIAPDPSRAVAISA